jgi:SIT family siderophore-iron:H+ symporter-like MFS transporter
MWCIIIPITSIPIYVGLIMAKRKAKRDGKLEGLELKYDRSSIHNGMLWFFWQLDVIGVILLTAMLALILIPLTIAGGTSANWHKGDVIAMLVIGILCIPAFAVWELKIARHPCVPFHLLNNRTILAGLMIAMMLNMCWYLQGE